MKPQRIHRLLSFIITNAILCAVVIGCMCSCTTTKHVQRANVTKDSTRERELSDSLQLLKIENLRMEMLLKESEYATAVFDSTKCPDIIFPVGLAMLNKDSVQRLIIDLNNALNGMNNKVKSYADGSLEISGRLKYITRLKEKESRSLIDMQSKYDSLRLVKQKEKVITHTVTKTIEKDKKTKFLGQWWLFPAGMIFMALIFYRKRIYSFLNPTSMKNLILFALCAMFLTSCGGAGQLPTDHISLSQAFAHVSQSFGYWIWVIIAVGAACVYVFKVTTSSDGWDGQSYLFAFLLLVAIACAILIRPCDVAANTTVEQAARGVYIGY